VFNKEGEYLWSGNLRIIADMKLSCYRQKEKKKSRKKGFLRDIASLCINLNPKTVQFSPPIFGQFCEKLIFFFSILNT
jgi:hypothetical protein